MSTRYDVWTDPDLDELVGAEPELVAIADALAQADRSRAVAGGKRRSARSVRLVALVATLAVAGLVALVAPWNRSSGRLSDMALAAIGSGPVLHVIAETPTGAQLVDVQTGAVQEVMQQEEIWYDAVLGVKRDVIRTGGAATADTLETPEGGYTPGGIVYDCAWIAAHPVAATKAHVSCNAAGDNGTKPRVVSRPNPSLQPGLAGFVDGYQQVLANGQARNSGSGELDGRPVDWLVFQTADGTEKVALDQMTHKPVMLEDQSGLNLKIETIETVPYNATDFARPSATELSIQPSQGNAADAQALEPSGHAVLAVMSGAAWLGASVSGLPLVRAEQQQLTASFAHGTPAPQSGIGVELDYGTLATDGRLDRTLSYVEIHEAPSESLAFGNMWGFIRGGDPDAGMLYVATAQTASEQLGFTTHDRAYLTIEASSRDLLLAAARRLTRPGG